MNVLVATDSLRRKIFMEAFENKDVQELQKWLLIAPFSETLFKTIIDIENRLKYIL